jgi:hypothetical protein
MAKDNANGNSHPPRPTIHRILQGKGGVGKRLVASWLAERTNFSPTLANGSLR